MADLAVGQTWKLSMNDEELNVQIHSVDIQFNQPPDYYETLGGESYSMQNGVQEIKIYGYIRPEGIKYLTEGTSDMRECAKACDDYEESYCDEYIPKGKKLVKKIKSLARSEDEKLLLKYEVVDEEGNLTNTGKELLLEVLFNMVENKKALLGDLKELEKAEKKAKK